MDLHLKKQQNSNTWKDYGQSFYDFVYQNYIDWPVTSLQWGNILHTNQQYVNQRLFFSCRTDGLYNTNNSQWQNTPNYIIMSSIELPTLDHYFINELKSLFHHDAIKKHPNMKIKQIISHPGQVTVIRTAQANKKILASKSDTNHVYLWTSDRYKMNSNASFATNPDTILHTTKGQKPNYALKFAPSLMRLITSGGNKIELFDLQSPGSTKRELGLGSFSGSNALKPVLTLEGHEMVEDIAFKNNQVWISGGQDKQIGIWDYRTKSMTHKIKNIHNHDINCVSVRQHIILSGGQQGRLNIIDDRKNQVIYKKDFLKPVRSLSFNPANEYFGVGSDMFSMYNMNKIEESNNIQPIFIHHGIKSSINEFDWNQDSLMTIAMTCQQEADSHMNGGLIHFFKPSDLFFDSKEQALDKIQKAYKKLNKNQSAKVDQVIQQSNSSLEYELGKVIQKNNEQNSS